MSSGAELHAAYQVANAPLNLFPYPHFYIENIFPADFYRALQAMLPESNDMRPIGEVRPVRGYKERFVLELGGDQLAVLPENKREFWLDLRKWLVAGRFGQIVLNKFGQYLDQRFSKEQVSLYDEALLVQDITNYKLGPHTDKPSKVITLLFYLPKDESQKHLGTSMYVPKDPAFRCPGGPHHPHNLFERVWTMPFLPNALFAFLKTDISFHGVEPIADEDCRRWLLLYDIYVDQPQQKLVDPAPATPATVKFSF
jgi:hypothetical protein